MKSTQSKATTRLKEGDRATLLILANQALHVHRIEQDEGRISITHDSDRTLSQLRELYPHLKRQIDAAFVLERKGNGLARIRFANDDIKKLVLLASDDHAKLVANYPNYEFFPIYRVMMKFSSIIPQGPGSLMSYLETELPVEIAVNICEFICRLVSAFCRALNRPWVKKAQENFERSANDNFQGLLKNLTAIAERHSDVVVLRFETFYEPRADDSDARAEQLGHLEELLADRKRLHAWLRKRFKRDLLLYAWTLEHGPQRGLHHHYLVVLKPTKDNQDHVNIVHEIEDKWSIITLGLGSIYNGNKHRSKQRYQALGLVHMTDPNAVKGLQLIAAYLTLANVYVKLNVGCKLDSFGKGGIMGGDAPSVYPKLGRPAKRRLPVPIAISAAEGRARVNFI